MTFLGKLKGWATEVKDAVIWGVKHPRTVRKAVVAAAVHAAMMVTVFSTLFPHTSAVHAATLTAITALCTGVATFLSSNGVVERTGGP